MCIQFVLPNEICPPEKVEAWGDKWMCLLSDPAIKAATLGQSRHESLSTVLRLLHRLAGPIARSLGLRDPDAPDLMANDTILQFERGKISFEFDPIEGKPLSFVRTVLWNVGRKYAREIGKHPAQPIPVELMSEADPVELASRLETVSAIRKVLNDLTDGELDLLSKRFGELNGRMPSEDRWTQREYERLSRLLSRLRELLRA